jgi:serine/threonine protein kinase
MIDRIEGTKLQINVVFHSKNLIHRDIKPENFVIDREDISLMFMIDFGLSKYYRSGDGKHIDFVQKKGMIGTARYSSINALQGMEQSRRDDLEAIGYVLIYFL